MQVRRFPAWGSRSCFYLSRLLSEQLHSGNDYTLLKPVIGIHLLDFDLFTAEAEKKQAVWCFEMRDALQPSVRLSRDLQLNLIELPKADRLGLNTEALRAWVNFFEHWNEEKTMAAYSIRTGTAGHGKSQTPQCRSRNPTTGVCAGTGTAG
jgi:predicted transposase/invertase (TIGR01784 family)